MQGFINFQGSTIKDNNAFYIPAADAEVSIVDARDIAAVAVQALINEDKHYNKTYMVTGCDDDDDGEGSGMAWEFKVDDIMIYII
jgi:uncharacterized protein YbjT (DUF2867 family)